MPKRILMAMKDFRRIDRKGDDSGDEIFGQVQEREFKAIKKEDQLQWTRRIY